MTIEVKGQPSYDEMAAYLRTQEGWQENYVHGLGMRWTFYPRDRRRRASDDYTLTMAYDIAKSGRQP